MEVSTSDYITLSAMPLAGTGTSAFAASLAIAATTVFACAHTTYASRVVDLWPVHSQLTLRHQSVFECGKHLRTDLKHNMTSRKKMNIVTLLTFEYIV